MAKRFAFFVACTLLVQSSSVTLSIDPGIQSTSKLDFAILRAYETISILQIEKTVNNILNIILDSCPASGSSQSKYAAGDNLNALETCQDQIRTPMIAAFNATLAGILTIDLEGASLVATAGAVIYISLSELIGGICSTIDLSLGNNLIKSEAEIQVIVDKLVSEATTINAAIFSAIENGSITLPAIDVALESARSKATGQLITAIRGTLTVIRTSKVKLCSKTATEDTYEAIKNELCTKFNADLETKFNLFRTVSLALNVLQVGTTYDSLTCQAVTESSSSNSEKTDYDDSTECELELPTGSDDNENGEIDDFCDAQTIETVEPYDCNDTSNNNAETCEADFGHGSASNQSTGAVEDNDKVDKGQPDGKNDLPPAATGHESETLADFCTIQAARQEALSTCFKALDIIFHVIKVLLAEVSSGNENASGHNIQTIEKAKKETIIAAKMAIDAILRAILLISHKSSLQIKIQEPLLHIEMSLVIERIYEGIELSWSKNEKIIVHKIQKLQEKVITKAVTLLSDKIYKLLQDVDEIDPATESAMARSEDLIISKVVSAYNDIFIGIDILLTAVFPNIQFGIDYSTLSLEAALDGATQAFKVVLDTRFDMIQTHLMLESSKNNTETMAKYTALASTVKTGIVEAGRAIDLIFAVITDDLSGVSLDNKEVKDQGHGTISVQVNTFNAFKAALDSTMDSVLITVPEAATITETLRSAAHLSVKRLVGDIFAALDICRNSYASLLIETKLTALQEDNIAGSVNVISDIYTAIRNGQKHDPEMETAIQSANETSTFELIQTMKTIFTGIKLLLRNESSGIHDGNKNSSSLVIDLKKEASRAIQAELQTHNDLFYSILTASVKGQTKLTPKSCTGTIV